MTDKIDLYARVTNKILADLESGHIPWHKPWQAGHSAGKISTPLRHNLQPYSGVNVLMLWAEAASMGYVAPIWLTYKQASELGGQVRKGEHGSMVVYANTAIKKEKNDLGEDVTRSFHFLKSYTVFNVEQIDGLPAHYYVQDVEPLPIESRLAHVDEFIGNTKAVIKSGTEAFYRPSDDSITMPDIKFFESPESYYAVLLHELTHWTKAETRLDRTFNAKRFGDSGYAQEELVAEIGSAFLCAALDITPEARQDHAAYIESWIKVLKNDKRAIFTAASHAQKAADFLQTMQQNQQTIAA